MAAETSQVDDSWDVLSYLSNDLKDCAQCLECNLSKKGTSSNSDCDRDKSAQMLPCLHSFCSECIGVWKKPECPICKKKFDAADVKPNALLTDVLIKIVQECKMRHNIEAKNQTADLRNKKDQETCEKHSRCKDLFCVTCNVLLCERCAFLEHPNSSHVCVENLSKHATLLLESVGKNVSNPKENLLTASNQEKKYSEQLKIVTDLRKDFVSKIDANRCNAVENIEKSYNETMKQVESLFSAKESVLKSSIKKLQEYQSSLNIKLGTIDSNKTELQKTILDNNSLNAVSVVYKDFSNNMKTLEENPQHLVTRLDNIILVPFAIKITPSQAGNIVICENVVVKGLQVEFSSYCNCYGHKFRARGTIISVDSENALIKYETAIANHTYESNRRGQTYTVSVKNCFQPGGDIQHVIQQ